MGTRRKNGTDDKGKPTFGPYEWKTYVEGDKIMDDLARGMHTLGLFSDPRMVDDKSWRFNGIWSLNCEEWAMTLLAAMHYNVTTVGFYDAMTPNQVDFILN